MPTPLRHVVLEPIIFLFKLTSSFWYTLPPSPLDHTQLTVLTHPSTKHHTAQSNYEGQEGVLISCPFIPHALINLAYGPIADHPLIHTCFPRIALQYLRTSLLSYGLKRSTVLQNLKYFVLKLSIFNSSLLRFTWRPL